MRLLHHYLIDSAQRFPEKAAIVCNERKLSYSELVQRMIVLSTTLSNAGLQNGDRAMILLNDKADLLVASYSVIARGAIAVPLLEGTAPSTVEQIAFDYGPSILITSSNDLANYPLLRDKLSCKVLFIEASPNRVMKRVSSKAIFIDKVSSDVREDDGALILFTAGTTGRKKGVLLSHRNLVESTISINRFMGIDSEICEFVALPLAHSFGFGRSRCIFSVGGTLVLNNGMLNPVTIVQSVERYACNAISSVPSGFAIFLGRLESLLQRIGPQIRTIELGSSPMPLDHKLKMLEIFPNARICMHYGLTEAPRSTFVDFRKEQRKLHTAGRPSPSVEVSIGNDEGRILEEMQIGEIFVRGEHVAVGYWQNEELNRQRFTSDRWFRTGDYGFLDEEGYLHLLGRKDEMINMSGVKISPLEVEEKIREVYPDTEVCVVGVPDPEGIVGEIPVLCYMARDGRTITPSDLSRTLSTLVDRNKIPRIVYRISDLPKSGNIKVLRRELRQKIIAGSVHELQPID